MIKRKFGWTDIEVPIIGQGTWLIDNGKYGNYRDKYKLAIKALRLGIDLGMTHIDTAEMYGDGRVEELVGKAIEGQRDRIFLVTKVLPSNASYEGTIDACKRSLKRLKTDRIDLYLLHWPSSYPIKDTMRAMEYLVAEGLIRFIGVSNFDLEKLKDAESVLKNERIACNQVLYNLGYRAIELNLLPYCIEKKIAIVGYSPFGHSNFNSLQKSSKGKILSKIAENHQCTVRQVILNFLTRHHNIFAIPKSSQPEHVKENSASVGWNLGDDEVATINKIFPIPENDRILEMI